MWDDGELCGAATSVLCCCVFDVTAVCRSARLSSRPAHGPALGSGANALCVCVIAHANGGSRGPRKDRPVLLTVLHHREGRRWGVVRPGERRAVVCVFKAPRTYT